jgi:hypothetical protein
MTDSLPTIGLLGAEKQAAVSAALAWPERDFLFVSDQRVIDGWDLPNVTALRARPEQLPTLLMTSAVHWVPLCARWQPGRLPGYENILGNFSLHAVMDALAQRFGEVVLPVRFVKPRQGECIVKGNLWHRPDAPLSGEVASLVEVDDPHDAGVLYQSYWPRQRQFLATGRRLRRGAVELAVLAVHAEACARDDVLAAGETVRHERLAGLTLAMLDALDQRGFFTFNWLERDGQVRLTSVRPVPRAVFRTFRRAGWDSFAPVSAEERWLGQETGDRRQETGDAALSPVSCLLSRVSPRPLPLPTCPSPGGVRVAPPGLKFAVDIHYSSYQPLVA